MSNNIDDFIYQPMISYLGNKRKLIGHIEKYVVKSKPKTALDGFCGSGVVSRMMKGHVKRLYVNDLEPYSIAIQRGFLPNITDEEREKLEEFIESLNVRVDELVASRKKPQIAVISRYYSPKDSNSILEGERCFYSTENGLRIDHYISLLSSLLSKAPNRFVHAAIANLLVKCSIHTNTSGVFKAFYKVDGLGHWGGYKEHDLQRILRPIRLECPIYSKGGEVEYCIGTINNFWSGYSDTLGQVDFTYYDPPYNQHPYGSNYFMLNVIYRAITEPDYISSLSIDPNSVSGIPKDWTRSDFNYEKSALTAIRDMIDNSNSRDILVSYNDGGLVSKDDILEILGSRGMVEVEDICYKNLNSRPNKKMGDKVNEYLFYSRLDDS
jgi:adenine-specific DNA-methyltransferase